jgi:hypothetical protein
MVKISEAGSIKGYSFKVWLSRNKDTLKLLLMGASGVAANVSSSGLNSTLKWTLTFAVPLIVKLLVDAIDFYTSDVKL